MTEPLLHSRSAANAVYFTIAWLRPIGDSPLQFGSKRWSAGAPLPYWMPTRITGGSTILTDYPVVRIHTVADSETAVHEAMDRANARMRILDEDPLVDVQMDDGSTANCLWAEMIEGPRPDPMPYSSVMSTDPAAAAVSRLVSTWTLAIPLV